jgi:hypothetical protein
VSEPPAAPLTCQWCGRPVPPERAAWWDGRPQCPDPFDCDRHTARTATPA